jgi:hypothetical protein
VGGDQFTRAEFRPQGECTQYMTNDCVRGHERPAFLTRGTTRGDLHAIYHAPGRALSSAIARVCHAVTRSRAIA